MLKQLPCGALQPLTQLLTEMERTGRSPGQWRVVKFAMLAKKADIERPIGLCDVVYKAWLQVRFSLVTAWMKQYAALAPWDAARPGTLVFPYPSTVCSKLSLPKLITSAG